MYLSFYKLNKKPFQISTDPKFLWLGKKHQEALSILQYAFEDDKGFLLLTGDVGTGKTTLLNAFVNSLDSDIIVARVSDPGLTQLEFIKYIAERFRMDTEFETKSEFLILFTRFLEDADRTGRKVLLIIDEAQHLTDEILEQIRLLSNIENQDKKLLNIFLVGQNEFNATLEKYKNRALRQRITISYTLTPLNKEETKACIEYRLGVAGAQKHLFTPEAVDAIYTLSEGFPRVINIICDHALFQGCQEKCEEISDEMIWKISKNIRFSHIPQSFEEPDIGSSTDDDWLEEAEDVPELSFEEIDKASRPLPDIPLLYEEEEAEEPRKRGFAIPLIFLLIVISIVFVFDKDTVNSLRQLFQNESKETITSPINSSPPVVTPAPTDQEPAVQETTPPELEAEEIGSEITPQKIVSPKDQKKSAPEPPERASNPKQVDETVGSEPVSNTSGPKTNVTTQSNSLEESSVSPEKSEEVTIQPIVTQEALPAEKAAIAEAQPETEQLSADKENTVTTQAEVEDAENNGIIETLTASIAENPALKIQETEEYTLINMKTPTQTAEIEETQKLESAVELTEASTAELNSPEQIDEPADAAPAPQKTEPEVNQAASSAIEVEGVPTTDEGSQELPEESGPATPETGANTVANEPEEGTEETQEEATTTKAPAAEESVEQISVEPATEETSNPKVVSTEVEVEETSPETEPGTQKPQPLATTTQSEPSEPEDPGAVIDWLLNSKGQ